MSLDYLEYYAGLSEPGYAVLVVGPWGVGKTFQVRELLRSRDPVHVSLYGEPDVASVHEAVLAASLPTTTAIRSWFDRIGAATRNVGETLGGLSGATVGMVGQAATSLVLRQLRQQIDKTRLIVFDDLERSSISTKELTGLINEYVEQHGCGVVVIANEEELPKDMSPIMEKLFGQTVTIEPRLDAAFESFFGLSTHAELWSDPVRRAVRGVFEHSDVRSLRVARQLVHDVSRLLGALSDAQRADEDAVEEMVTVFAAWAVEVRARRLERHHVDPRSPPAIARALALSRKHVDDRVRADHEASDWETVSTAEQRYLPLGIHLRSAPWPADLLETLLFDGSFPPARIQASLDNTPWFRTAAALPAWRVLWSWFEHEDEELVEAAERLSAQLRDRVPPEDSGHLVHLVTRMLHAAKWGLVDLTVDQARELCEGYIDDMVRVLYPMSTPGSGSSGLGFCDKDSPVWDDYRRVRVYLNEAAISHLENSMPDVAASLLDALSTRGADAFADGLERLPQSGRGEPLACLHTLDPDVFVARWLARPAREHLPVAAVLSRHRDRCARTVDASKKDDGRWIESLAQSLDRAATTGTIAAAPFRLRALATQLSVQQ